MGIHQRLVEGLQIQPSPSAMGGEGNRCLPVCPKRGCGANVGQEKEQPWDDVRETEQSHEVGCRAN